MRKWFGFENFPKKWPFSSFASFGLMYSKKLLIQSLDFCETLAYFDPEIDVDAENEAEMIALCYESLKKLVNPGVLFENY